MAQYRDWNDHSEELVNMYEDIRTKEAKLETSIEDNDLVLTLTRDTKTRRALTLVLSTKEMREIFLLLQEEFA